MRIKKSVFPESRLDDYTFTHLGENLTYNAIHFKCILMQQMGSFSVVTLKFMLLTIHISMIIQIHRLELVTMKIWQVFKC